jgi:hypothetical protein
MKSIIALIAQLFMLCLPFFAVAVVGALDGIPKIRDKHHLPFRINYLLHNVLELSSVLQCHLLILILSLVDSFDYFLDDLRPFHAGFPLAHNIAQFIG